MNEKFALGSKAKDRVTGFSGVIVSKHVYLNGCVRYSLQPPVDKDGKLPTIETFDEQQLDVIVDTTQPATNPSGKVGGDRGRAPQLERAPTR